MPLLGGSLPPSPPVAVLGDDFTNELLSSQEAVVGIGTTQNGSDAKYIVKTASTQDDTDAFNENTPFETEADAILDFSEGNPFGEF